jgi:hypothetical protein
MQLAHSDGSVRSIYAADWIGGRRVMMVWRSSYLEHLMGWPKPCRTVHQEPAKEGCLPDPALALPRRMEDARK